MARSSMAVDQTLEEEVDKIISKATTDLRKRLLALVARREKKAIKDAMEHGKVSRPRKEKETRPKSSKDRKKHEDSSEDSMSE